MKGVLESIQPHFHPLQVWINSFTSLKHVVVGDRLEKRLEKLECNTSTPERNNFSSMSNLGNGFTSALRVSPTVDTSGVISAEAFAKLNATVARLEA